MLHVEEAGDPRNICDQAPDLVEDLVTLAEAREDGSARYYVYILATPEVPADPVGMRGVRLGIEYDQGDGERINVFSWNSCSGAEFRQTEWPASGSGITLTYDECTGSEVIVGGYFYITAYSPSVIALTGFPSTGVVEYLDCSGATEEFVPVDEVQVGWISMGGAARGFDANGCNPAIEPCNVAPSPVQTTTWGKIKAKYGP
jgi:hypothetical protein